MDANLTAFVLLAGQEQLLPDNSSAVYDIERNALVCAPAHSLRLASWDTIAAARAAYAGAQPTLLDAHGQLGSVLGNQIVYWSGSDNQEPLRDGELQDVTAPSGNYVDLDANTNGRLVAAYTDQAAAHGVSLFLLSSRQVSHAELSAEPLRVMIGDDDVCWVLTARSIICLTGQPLPQPYLADTSSFEPKTANPYAFAQEWQQALPGDWRGLAICGSETSLCVLAADANDQQTLLIRERNGRPDAPFIEVPLPAIGAADAPDLGWAVDIGHVNGELFALLGAWREEARDCAVVEVPNGGRDGMLLTRVRYPMASRAEPRFVKSADGECRYLGIYKTPQEDTAAGANAPPGWPRRLQPLARPAYPHAAQFALTTEPSIDTLEIWHRLVLDACIPKGCSIRCTVSWEESGDTLSAELPELLPVRYKEAPDARQLWETPFQRSGADGPAWTVSRIETSRLRLRFAFSTDGRATPALFSVRAYYPRFSYQEAYLPRHMRQFDQPQRSSAGANGPDVRERMLMAFESIATRLEDDIAQSERFIHPAVTDESNLAWLGEVLGNRTPRQWPEARQREFVEQSGLLQKWRGTMGGLCRALNIASEGAVAAGRLIPVENFRLRRTFATVLGIDMDDEHHPLTLGTGMSGNSIVGPSLILSEAEVHDFLALAAPGLVAVEDRPRVLEFFERYAHQLTVLVHGSDVIALTELERLLEQWLPAHLIWKVVVTDKPFVLGLAPLLDYHTRLLPPLTFQRVRLGHSYLGAHDVISNRPAFSPRAAHTTGESI